MHVWIVKVYNWTSTGYFLQHWKSYSWPEQLFRNSTHVWCPDINDIYFWIQIWKNLFMEDFSVSRMSLPSLPYALLIVFWYVCLSFLSLSVNYSFLPFNLRTCNAVSNPLLRSNTSSNLIPPVFDQSSFVPVTYFAVKVLKSSATVIKKKNSLSINWSRTLNVGTAS